MPERVLSHRDERGQAAAVLLAGLAVIVLGPRLLAAHGGAAGVSTPYEAEFRSAGAAHGVPPSLLQAVASVESGFNPRVQSSAGAQGLMQFMPGTWRTYGQGRSPWDPAASIDAAAAKLAHDGAAGGDAGGIARALHAYNPSWPYVRTVLARWRQ
ncbi:MAG TPA: lytic transglycosylase domain-containing protein, partial [Candidatus Dormibacteraeota bacterium]|nr:lytic transglycosylase domain-containing protein [Candidatus Dormibacteraeota bacterium]